MGNLESTDANTHDASVSTAMADALCQTTAPSGGTYKALLIVNGATSGNRVACTSPYCNVGGNSEHIDWPLQPNTTYSYFVHTINGIYAEYLTTTNNNALMIESMTHTIPIIPDVGVWIGVNPDWTSSSDNCNNWTANVWGYSGEVGNSDNGGGQSFWSGTAFGSTGFCTQGSSLYCVQQYNN